MDLRKTQWCNLLANAADRSSSATEDGDLGDKVNESRPCAVREWYERLRWLCYSGLLAGWKFSFKPSHDAYIGTAWRRFFLQPQRLSWQGIFQVGGLCYDRRREASNKVNSVNVRPPIRNTAFRIHGKARPRTGQEMVSSCGMYDIRVSM